MEQRPLRLGDIVDDYCPRERRITNHAIVAVVNDSIRQTRCTTCDAEHAYKGAREPRRRAAKDESALFDQVLADIVPGQLVQPRPKAVAPPPETPPAHAAPSSASADPARETDAPDAADSATQPPGGEFWPAHRQLIRATLPRTDHDPVTPRPIPEFTMHQRNTRGANAFRQGQGFDWSNGHGNGPAHGGGRPGRPGEGPGQGRPGNNRPGRHRSRHKRSRQG